MSQQQPALAAHKRNFDNYIARGVGPTEMQSSATKQFNQLAQDCLHALPDEAPVDGYAYNAHMGEFVRALDYAKDEYTKACCAFVLPALLL